MLIFKWYTVRAGTFKHVHGSSLQRLSLLTAFQSAVRSHVECPRPPSHNATQPTSIPTSVSTLTNNGHNAKHTKLDKSLTLLENTSLDTADCDTSFSRRWDAVHEQVLRDQLQVAKEIYNEALETSIQLYRQGGVPVTQPDVKACACRWFLIPCEAAAALRSGVSLQVLHDPHGTLAIYDFAFLSISKYCKTRCYWYSLTLNQRNLNLYPAIGI